MVSTPTTQSPPLGQPDQFTVPAFVDWIVGAFLVLAGAALALGGSALWWLVDRQAITGAVADGRIQSGSLSASEIVEVALATATWTGIGMTVTGFTLLISGIAYVVLRRRSHAHAATGERGSEFVAHAVIGAVASGVLGFVPFSPVLGGAIAGYLERSESDRVVQVGGVSGVLAMAPLLAVVAFVLGGVSAGLLSIGDTGLATFVAILLLVVLASVATIGAGLGALGGYVGGRLATHDR